MPSDYLVYTYGTTHTANPAKQPERMTPKQLEDHMYYNGHLQATPKKIKGQTYVDVYRKDLYTPEQKAKYHSYPNYEANLASVKVGWWKAKRYDELVILSEKKGT